MTKKQKEDHEIEQFLLLEALEYAQEYHPDGFSDIARIRKAVIQLLKGRARD